MKKLSLYYKHPQMGDGHLNKCKKCAISDSLDYRHENLERIQEYDRIRGRTEKRKLLNIKYSKTTNGKLIIQKAKNKWAKRNKHKTNAQLRLRRAVANGLVMKQNCQKCNSNKSHGHHEDYNKPLSVIWLCSKHHSERHIEIRNEQRNLVMKKKKQTPTYTAGTHREG